MEHKRHVVGFISTSFTFGMQDPMKDLPRKCPQLDRAAQKVSTVSASSDIWRLPEDIGEVTYLLTVSA